MALCMETICVGAMKPFGNLGVIYCFILSVIFVTQTLGRPSESPQLPTGANFSTEVELTTELSTAKDQPAIEPQRWSLRDVKYSKAQTKWLQRPPHMRAGFKFPRKLWPGGVVPYFLDLTITEPTVANQVQLGWFHQGRQMIENVTCVQFIPRTSELDYVRIGRWARPCQSELGKKETGGEQFVNLGQGNIGCDNGTVAHELFHTLGVLHEHQRYDRDDFIDIDWNALRQVSTDQQFNWLDDYQKDGTVDMDFYGQPYAYDSIMHYPRWSPGTHSKPPQIIFPKFDNDKASEMGQARYLAAEDIGLINAMYCNNAN